MRYLGNKTKLLEHIAAVASELGFAQGTFCDLFAGSGVVGILIAVLLVLIILDIVGVTNIFSFIHSPSK